MPALTLSPAGRRYGWIPSAVPPPADAQYYKIPKAHLAKLPPRVDLRLKFAAIPIYDQGRLGSCVGNSVAADVAFLRQQARLPNQWTPSRLEIYFNSRLITGNADSDSGTSVSAAFATLGVQGVTKEAVWPYIESNVLVQPPAAVYAVSKQHTMKGAVMFDPRNLQSLKSCLASGFPFVIGFQVYTSFESPGPTATGVIPDPNPQAEQLLGGHSTLVTGYDDTTQRFKSRNSWGTGWGDQGWFTISYRYLTSMGIANDFHMAHGCS